MARRVITRKPELDPEGTLDEYLKTRSLRERSAWNEDRLKAILMDFLAENGEEDSDGHRTYDLDEPVEYYQHKSGKAVPKHVTGILRQHRIISPLNEDRTMALLKRKNLVDECTEIQVVINEDALLAANYEGRITDEEMDALYDKKDQYAFYLTMED